MECLKKNHFRFHICLLNNFMEIRFLQNYALMIYLQFVWNFSLLTHARLFSCRYMKYLYPYECEKKHLSTPAELQAAIDGNRREGRRTSYGQFESQMQQQLQLVSMTVDYRKYYSYQILRLQPQMQRSPIPNSLQQMSPLSLVTHGNPNPHRLMGAPPVGQLPNIVSHDIEQRMLEYIKLFQAPKDMKRKLTERFDSFKNLISKSSPTRSTKSRRFPRSTQRSRDVKNGIVEYVPERQSTESTAHN